MILDFNALGQRIAKRRKDLGMTQEDMAERAGLTPTHVRNIERAYTKCSLDALWKICEAMEVTPDYLFLGVLKCVDEDQLATATANLRLCDKKQLNLVMKITACVLDESIPQA